MMQSPAPTPPQTLSRKYEIRDVSGAVVAIHWRTEEAGKKSFSWMRPGGLLGLDGQKTVDLPLYGINELAAHPDDRVVITEGEKARDFLANAGILAVGTVCGAAVTPSVTTLRALEGRDVVLWPDADEAGRKHMAAIAEQLRGVAGSVRIVDWPTAPPKGDAADFVDLHGDGAMLTAAIDGAPLVEHAEVPVSTAGPVFSIMSAKQLCSLPDLEPDASLLGPALVRGARTLIGAHTGHGKTTFALGMVRAVVDSNEFLGWKGAGGRALVIDAEQGQRTIQRQLREAGLDQSENVHYLRVPDGLSLNKNAAEVTAIEAALVLQGPFDIVLADPLYKLHTGDSNSEREAVDLMRVFDGWREQYRFALLMATHTRKPPAVGGRFSMHEFFGSGAYLRGAEVVLGLEFVRSGVSRLHFFKDRDGDLPVGTKWSLTFTREGGFLRDPGGDIRPNAEQRVAEILAADPTITNEALARTTGLKPDTVRKARKKVADAVQSRALIDEEDE